MSQQFNVESRPNCSEGDIFAWVREMQTTSANKPGHHRRDALFPDKPYTVDMVGTVFESHGEAESWILSNNERMKPVHAVRYKEYVQLTREELGEEYYALLKAASDINTQVQRFSQDVVRAAVIESPKEMLSCSNCKSKIAKAFYLQFTPQAAIECPVCKQNLLETAAQSKARAKLKEKHKKALQAIQDFEVKRRKQLKKDAPIIRWLIGGWCAEKHCEC